MSHLCCYPLAMHMQSGVWSSYHGYSNTLAYLLFRYNSVTNFKSVCLSKDHACNCISVLKLTFKEVKMRQMSFQHMGQNKSAYSEIPLLKQQDWVCSRWDADSDRDLWALVLGNVSWLLRVIIFFSFRGEVSYIFTAQYGGNPGSDKWERH